MDGLPPNAKKLQELIESKQAKLGVIGLGYVGLPLSYSFLCSEFPVLGFDIDQSKIDKLEKGESYIHHLGDAAFKKLADSELFEATTDFSRLSEADVIMICVPTPVGKHREPDLSYVLKSGESIRQNMREGQLIILESTTYPGTTDEDLRGVLDQSGLKLGTEYFLAFSPEREDPGNPNFETTTIPKVVGGVDAVSGDLAVLVYKQAIKEVIPVSDARVAEASKLMENIYRAVNIALVNELKMIFSRLDIDIWEVLDASSTKPFGFHRFNPGPGWGGHCIPIDPFYLTWKAKAVGSTSHFIERAGEINILMTDYVVQQVQDALNNHQKSLKGANILILGVAYKGNIDDARESPAFPIMKKLKDYGAELCYHDPHIPSIPKTRKWPTLLGMDSLPFTPETLEQTDAVLVITKHKATELAALEGYKGIVIDTRNAVPQNLGLHLYKA